GAFGGAREIPPPPPRASLACRDPDPIRIVADGGPVATAAAVDGHGARTAGDRERLALRRNRDGAPARLIHRHGPARDERRADPRGTGVRLDVELRRSVAGSPGADRDPDPGRLADGFPRAFS